MRNRTFAALAAGASLLAVAACGGSGSGGGSSSGKTIVIGFLAPLSGAVAQGAQQMVNGAQLAVEQINGAGGVGGHKLELKVYDDHGSADGATQAAQRAITINGAKVLLGGYSSTEGLAIRSVAERNHVVYINPSSGSHTIVDGAKYTYLLATREVDYPTVDARIVVNLKSTAPAVLHDNGPYGSAVTPLDIAALKAVGLDSSRSVGYAVGASDMSTAIASLKALHPDSVIWGGASPADGGLIAKTMVEQGLDVPLVGLSALALPDAFRVANGAFDELPGVYATQNKDTTKPEYQAFIAAYVKKYGGDANTAATLGDAAAQSYDAVQAIAGALKANGAQASGDALVGALSKLAPFTGVSGRTGVTISFATSHEGYGTPPLLAYKLVHGVPVLAAQLAT